MRCGKSEGHELALSTGVWPKALLILFSVSGHIIKPKIKTGPMGNEININYGLFFVTSGLVLCKRGFYCSINEYFYVYGCWVLVLVN